MTNPKEIIIIYDINFILEDVATPNANIINSHLFTIGKKKSRAKSWRICKIKIYRGIFNPTENLIENSTVDFCWYYFFLNQEL